MILYRRWLSILCFLILLPSCKVADTRADEPKGESEALQAQKAMPNGESDAPGLYYQLTTGVADAALTPAAKATDLKPLSEVELFQLLKRLPDFVTPPKVSDFSLRESSLPLPRIGGNKLSIFPPLAKPEVEIPKADAKSLQVLRYSPEGDVPVAPQLSVTFNQPMVSVTSHQELQKLDPPVILKPKPAGDWRWIGTSTVLFQPKGEVSPDSGKRARFPMATDYKVDILAGTKSANGASLAKTQSFSFSTPTVTVIGSGPSDGPNDLEPLIWMNFDQDVDPQAVFKTVKLTGNGSDAIPLRLATPKEMEASRLDQKNPKRWLIFKAARRLQPATSYTVTLGPGTPSAEGPLLTKMPQSFSFYTYDKFKIIRDNADNEELRPLSPLAVYFNNPIQVEKFEPAMVKVSPQLPNLKVSASGDTILITGDTRGRTSYTVTLNPELSDVYGQRLEEPRELTFKIGSAEPSFMAAGELLVVLDPSRRSSFPVYVMNESKLKVKMYSVGPADWGEFLKRLREENDEKPFTSPGQEVVNTTLETKAQPDELTEVAVDLKPALRNGLGMAVIVVEVPGKWSDWWERRRKRIVRWVQVTDIGLDAASDNQKMQVFTSSLKDATPMDGTKLTLSDGSGRALKEATSGKDGLATIDLPSSQAPMVVAQNGDDLCILPRDTNYYGYYGWQKVNTTDQMLWCVVDDRNIYRPGEEVSLKGWVRRWQPGPKGDIAGLEGGLGNISWAAVDSLGNDILKGNASAEADGSFNFSFTLPKTVNLGRVAININADGTGSTSHYIEAQEFRRPEYEVSTSSLKDFALIGESDTVTAEAKYYAGGGLAGAPISWTTTALPGSFTPPGLDDYSFGAWTPWWNFESWRGHLQEVASGPAQQFSAVTDSKGSHHLKIDFLAVNPPRPMVLNAEASVTDVNRQAWSASSKILVHPSRYYVGLRTNATFAAKGEAIDLELVVSDLDGKVLSGVPVELVSWRNGYEIDKDGYKTTKEDESLRTLTSNQGAMKATLVPKRGGTYTIKARVVDDKGRPNESSLTLWVSGDQEPSAKNLEQQRLTLIPGQKEYKAGDTAEILVQSPFAPAEGTVSFRRSGILESKRISLTEPSTVLKVPITEAMVPNLTVQVDLSGATKTDKGGTTPVFASGSIDLSIPPLARTLAVEVTPASPSSDPGAKTNLEVVVKDVDGIAVADAEVTLFAVDEAVLALTNYQFPNPLDVFYGRRPADTQDFHSRQYVVVSRAHGQTEYDEYKQGVIQYKGGGGGKDEAVMVEQESFAKEAPMTAVRRQEAAEPMAAPPGSSAQPTSPIRMRTDFNPTALFAPRVKTDSAGKATVPFKLPDNLTRYRLVAIATDGAKRFGKGESKLVARLPLMVRPSAPRFLNFGDSFELPVVLQNQTDKDMDVQVGIRATNLKFTKASGYSLRVPANDRVEVRFPATTERAGKANVQVGASGPEGAADAAEVSLPVWTPATTEAFASYGQIDKGAIAQPVKAPQDVFSQFGGLEVTCTSTALQSLTDAVIYLSNYPFDCSEQVSSRLLTLAALRDVLWAFKAEGVPSSKQLKAQVKKDMDRLALIQQANGGFGFWPGSTETWPFVSVHVGHALARAKEKGYEVPENVLARIKLYMLNIEGFIPSNYDPQARQVIRAYALYVLNRFGDTDKAKIKALIAEAGGVTKLPLEAMGWLYYIICKDADYAKEVAEIRKYLNNHVTETAGNAHFVTGYSEDSGYTILASDRRVDGILLEAMIKDQPKSDLVAKIARGLLAGRSKGRWSNTQDNCFVILALDLYFNTYEKVTPDFVARAWLGSDFVGEQKFKGREVDYKSSHIPMSYLADKGERVLTLAKEGPGRLYYRIGMSYAPKSLKQEATDHGFTVERRYEGIDSAEDVKKDEKGVWHIRAGSRVKVSLSMVASARRYHVALVDPLPAGLEVINPALAVSGSAAKASTDDGVKASRWEWWWSTWYEHQNVRDERVEAYSSQLWGGVYEYSYVARATTPGTFVAPPTKAEEMYAPETFGRSASDLVVIE